MISLWHMCPVIASSPFNKNKKNIGKCCNLSAQLIIAANFVDCYSRQFFANSCSRLFVCKFSILFWVWVIRCWGGLKWSGWSGCKMYMHYSVLLLLLSCWTSWKDSLFWKVYLAPPFKTTTFNYCHLQQRCWWFLVPAFCWFPLSQDMIW